MTEKLTTSQLLQPQRLEGEDFETYKKRRKDMNKVVAQHLSFPGTYSAEYHNILSDGMQRQRLLKPQLNQESIHEHF